MDYKKILEINGFKEKDFGYPRLKTEDYKFREFRKGSKTITYSKLRNKFFANKSGIFNANFVSFDTVLDAIKYTEE